MAEPSDDGLDKSEPDERERREVLKSDRSARAIETLAVSIQKPGWKLLLAVAAGPTAAVLALAALLWSTLVARVDDVERKVEGFSPEYFNRALYDDIGNLEVHVKALNKSGQDYSQELERLLCKAAGFEIQLGTGECERPDFILDVHLFTDIDPYERSR